MAKTQTLRPAIAGMALLLGLAGCQAMADLTTVSDAQTAVGKAAAAITTIGDAQASSLSKAQAAACAGQALANALTDMLNSTGHQGDASKAAKISNALGYACTWTLPAR